MTRWSPIRTAVALAATVALFLALPSFASALSFQETSQSPLPNLTNVYDIATGDFDADGDSDMAVAAETGVVIWISDGDGSFTVGETLPIEANVNAHPTAVVTGDFNDDGKLDLAYADGPYLVYVALGKGDGTFTAPGAGNKFSPPFYLGAAQLAVADFNGDGKDDLVLGGGIHNSNFTEAGYQVFLSNGDGTFAPQSSVPVAIPLEAAISGVAVGDYSDDGKLDLALLVQPFNFSDYTSNQVLGEVGDGTGAFTAAAANPISLGLTEGGFDWAESTADIDGSGGDDLLVTVGTAAATLPLLGSSAGFLTLNAAGAITNGAGIPNAVTAADLDGDGLEDAITAYFTDNGSLGVGLGGATGNLTAAPGSPFGINQQHFFSNAVAAGDFNGDGHPDLAYSSNANTNGGPLTQGVAVLINSPEIGVAPTKLDFGGIEVGETATGIVTLSGLGAPDAEVSQVVLATGPGSPFSIVDPSACETIVYGEECELEVEYAPTSEGAATNTLEITSNTGPGGSDAISIVPLSGHGVGPGVALSPSGQDFGSAEVGGPAVTKSLTIRSSGGAPLNVTGVSISGSDFRLADPSACIRSLAAGATCDVAVAFAPSGTAGARSATLTVETNAGTRTAELSGTATVTAPPPPPGPAASAAAKLTLKGPATVKAGKQVKLKVQVSNTGNTAISGLALTTKAPKKLAKPPKAANVSSLAAGQSTSQTITVKLKEAATPGKKLKLTVTAVAAGKTLATGTLTVKVK